MPTITLHGGPLDGRTVEIDEAQYHLAIAMKVEGTEDVVYIPREVFFVEDGYRKRSYEWCFGEPANDPALEKTILDRLQERLDSGGSGVPDWQILGPVRDHRYEEARRATAIFNQGSDTDEEEADSKK